MKLNVKWNLSNIHTGGMPFYSDRIFIYSKGSILNSIQRPWNPLMGLIQTHDKTCDSLVLWRYLHSVRSRWWIWAKTYFISKVVMICVHSFKYLARSHCMLVHHKFWRKIHFFTLTFRKIKIMKVNSTSIIWRFYKFQDLLLWM